MYPTRIATARIVTVKVATNLGLNIDDSKFNSGILAPAPPIIKAINAPRLIPLDNNTDPMGIIVSTRIYMGTPIAAATGMAK